jgi:hypothetical protein
MMSIESPPGQPTPPVVAIVLNEAFTWSQNFIHSGTGALREVLFANRKPRA